MANLRTNNLSGEQGQNAYRGSVYFPGYVNGTVAEYLSIPDTDDLDIGTGDFTFECWVRAAESSGEYAGIFGMYNYDNAGLLIQLSNTGVIRLVNPTAISQSGSTVIIPQDGTMGDWHHIAVARSGSTIKAFVNGNEEISHSYSSAIDFCNGGFAVIGITDRNDYPGDYDLKGFISNLRLIKGTALYTAAFTPPTSELTIVDGTVLLCCQNSDDPTQEATGKTISAHGGKFQTGNKNILLNGDFSQGTTGFFGDSGASISESGGVMTVTNGGGDNLYALAQYGVCQPGQFYRLTATVTPTFASGNPVFRVRFGGNAESFVQPQATMSTGVAFRLDTGEKVADGKSLEIGSGNSSGITQFTITDLVVTAINPPIPVKNIPPYGVDAGNAFGGPIQQSTQGYMYFPTGRTDERGRGRGFYMLGYFGTPSASSGKRIDYINIQSQGKSIRFGDLTVNRYTMGAGANSTRGLFTGGYQDGLSPDTDVNAIEFITIATEGNATDFGDRTQVGRAPACASNDTRCVMASAFTPAGYQNTIDFVTIATIGNASDFGDLSTARAGMSMSCNSTTRGIFNGGYQPAPSTIRVNNMEFITFATTGNTQDFGDLTDDSQSTYGGTASSSTRGLIGLGYVHPARSNAVDFCTIATTGNASDFGDLTAAKQTYGSCSNSIRGLFLGGQTPSYINNIDMVSIATTGDATDFGDVNVGVTASGAAGSDSHGGLS